MATTPTNLFHYGLNVAIANCGMSPETQRSLAKLSATAAPLLLPFETKQITFDRHPLETLCHLLERVSQPRCLKETLSAVPETLRNVLFFEVWSQATDPGKGGKKWGELNALANHARLINVIKTIVINRLNILPQEKKDSIFGTIYRMAGQPQTNDLRWGEHHATRDLKRLVRAMHRKQCLDIPGNDIKVYVDLEKNLKTPSQFFHLNKRELPKGQIGLHNGMYNSQQQALNHAKRISTECAQEFNLHCTYSATVSLQMDTASAFIGQGGAITPPVLCLLEQWLDFIQSNDDQKLLQICHSRGAIEVHNALCQLPVPLRQRIIVITVAPACLIPADLAYRVINLVIESDPVVKVAANRELIDASHTLKLEPHNDTFDPHNMHGSSYREKMTVMIDHYIRANDIV